MKLLRLPAVQALFGYGSKTSVYLNEADGLLPHRVKISERSSAWPEAEIAAVVTARAAGATDDEIRALVSKLHAARGAAWAHVRASVGMSATEVAA